MTRRRDATRDLKRFVPQDINLPWSQEMEQFGHVVEARLHRKLYLWQGHAIHHIRNGRDVIIRAGTGMGKSLVFQALTLSRSDAIVLVIAPLLGIIDEQVTLLGSQASSNCRTMI
jgi:superfamily II DNA or RNA helicase